MKALRCILIMLGLAGLTMAPVGCGVSEDEHQKVVSELNQTKALLEKANAKIAQLKKSSKSAVEEAKTAIEKPEGPDLGLKERLASAQEEAAGLREKVEGAGFHIESIRLNGIGGFVELVGTRPAGGAK